MANKDFEIQQLLKAYRKGLISDELFETQMKELGSANGGLDVANVSTLRRDGSKPSAKVLQQTSQSQTAAFSLPANYSNDTRTATKGIRLSTSSMAVQWRGSRVRSKRFGLAMY